jgi:hypothetical protein
MKKKVKHMLYKHQHTHFVPWAKPNFAIITTRFEHASLSERTFYPTHSPFQKLGENNNLRGGVLRIY